jgi:D-glycerate 3-kinase
LQAWELADQHRAAAFGITPANLQETIQRRAQLLIQIYPVIQQRWQKWPVLDLLWTLWLPLAQRLVAQRQQQDQPLVQGILGGQGSGKTTLCAVLLVILKHLGYPTVSLSLDDLYKTHAERQRLQQQDPRFRWRGPPGTHDIELGVQTLERLRHPTGEPVAVPRFDKSAYGGRGDRTQPQWVIGVEIVLFEGWFVGVHPVDPAVLAAAPSPIDTESDRAFALETNEQLKEYLPLWEFLDQLMVLWPQDYRLSRQWRQQAEREAVAAGKSGMSSAEIAQFVTYFWQALHPALFIQPLLQDPQRVDLVVEIDRNHWPVAIYQPGIIPAS